MPLLTAPAALTAPFPGDQYDNEIANNRAEILKVVTEVNLKEARIAALEARPSMPPAATPVVTIPVTAAQEAQLGAVAVGSAAILRGPTGDVILVRQ